MAFFASHGDWHVPCDPMYTVQQVYRLGYSCVLDCIVCTSPAWSVPVPVPVPVSEATADRRAAAGELTGEGRG